MTVERRTKETIEPDRATCNACSSRLVQIGLVMFCPKCGRKGEEEE